MNKPILYRIRFKTHRNHLRVLFILLFLVPGINALSQTIKGKVVDRESGVGLPGANIVLLDSDPIIGGVSDGDGEFRLGNIPFGRHSIRVSFIGYEEVIIPEIMVGSAKEVVLSVKLQETAREIDEVTVLPKQKGSPRNPMSTVSARSFTVEETERYAGSLSDPGRMALSFPGVNTDDDLSNQIVIRGNSPNSMLWMLEGVQIPIPNHFYLEGWDAGYVSLLNTNMMGQSDFFTGAFPAEYGNTTSGVFDISFRNGNNTKREHTFEFGSTGVNLCAEGPFSKNYKGSYLVNFRYATFSLLNHIGIRIDGDILPSWHDLSFKIHLPTEKIGSFSIWGLGGKSYYEYKAIEDTSLWEENSYLRYGYRTYTKMGATGITHTIFPDDRSYFKSTLSVSGASSHDIGYKLDYDLRENPDYDELLSNSALRFSSHYNRKFNAKLSIRTGLIISKLYYDYLSGGYWDDREPPVWEEDIKGSGDSESYQGFLQMKYHITPAFSFNGGLHYLHFALNNEYSIEPRAGFRWELPGSQAITGGIGRHSRHEYLMHYFTKTEDDNGDFEYGNRNLELMKSNHYVLGYTRMFKPDLKFQVEVYYQSLSDVPVSPDSSKTFSPINDEVFGYEFVNEGSGRNYGIEFTLEKYFTNNYYFLITNSLYSAKYRPLDGNWYNSRYNNRYITNILGGKEFIIRGKNVLGVNGRFIWSGGRRYTPVDPDRQRTEDWDVYDQQRRNEGILADYLRLDLGVKYRINNPRVSHEFAVDIQNVTARENEGGAYYSSEDDKMIAYTLMGIFPFVNYRLYF
jgi:hypothetical protein